MCEYISMRNGIGQVRNGSTLTLVADSLSKLTSNSRRFNLIDSDDEQEFSNYLLKGSLPNLIIKIIGTNDGHTTNSLRASIQNVFKQVMGTLMKQTSELPYLNYDKTE